MLIHPAVALTDYAITLETVCFALILVRLGRAGQLWAVAFASTGLAAGFGGTVHGFANTLSLPMQIFLWQGVIASLGAAGCLMIVATAWETLKGRLRYRVAAIALVKAGFSLSFAIARLSFAWSVIDYLISMVIVLGLRQRANVASRSSIMAWTGAGVGLSIVAILPLLFSKPELDWLRPEVQYHIVQMLALYSLFGAARVCSTSNDRRSNTKSI